MAYRLKKRSKNGLVVIHVLSIMAWFGATLCMLLLGLCLKNAENGEQLYYTLASMHLIDENLLKYPGLAALVTGVMLSVWTQWGLVKYYWVVIKLILTIGIILFAIFFINDWFAFLITTAHQLDFASLQNPDFQTAWNSVISGAIFNITAMVIMTWITYFKPFGKIKSKQKAKSEITKQE